MATLASSYLLTENLVTTGAKGEDTRTAFRFPLEVKIWEMFIQPRGFRTTSMTKKPQMSLVPSADAGKSADGCQLSHSHMETHRNQINAVALSSSRPTVLFLASLGSTEVVSFDLRQDPKLEPQRFSAKFKTRSRPSHRHLGHSTVCSSDVQVQL